MLTFDDGGPSALDAAGELAHRAWRGHFFIVTSLVGRAGLPRVERHPRRSATWAT